MKKLLLSLFLFTSLFYTCTPDKRDNIQKKSTDYKQDSLQIAQLLDRADDTLELYFFNEALIYLKEADSILSGLSKSLPLVEARIDCTYGIIDVGTGKEEKSQYNPDLLDKSINSLKDTNNTDFVKLLVSFANFNYLKGDLSDAIRILKRAEVKSDQVAGDDGSIAFNISSNLAIYNTLNRSSSEVKKYNRKALAIAKNKFQNNSRILGSAHLNASIGFYFIEEPDSSLKYAALSKEILLQDSINNYFLLSQIDILRGLFLTKYGYLEEALVAINKKIELDTKLFGENHYGIANHYYRLANTYIKQGDYYTGLKKMQKAYDIALKTISKDNPRIALFFQGMGALYNLIGNTIKAEQYLWQGLKVAKVSYDKNAILKELSKIKYYNHDFDGALCDVENLIKATHLGQMSESLASLYTLKGMILYRKGIVSHEKQKIEEAIKTYENLIKFYKEQNKKIDLAFVYEQLGEYNDKIGRHDLAFTYFQKADVLYDELGSDDTARINVYYGYALIHFRLKEFQKAFNYADKAIKCVEFAEEKDYSNVGYLRLFVYDLKGLFYKTLYEQEGDLRDLFKADSLYSTALQTWHQTQDNYGESGWYVLRGITPCIENAIDIKLLLYDYTKDKQHKQEAFNLSEKYKSIFLSRVFKSLDAKKIAGIPDQIIDSLNNLKAKVAGYKSYIESYKKTISEEDKNNYQDTINNTNFKYEQLLEKVREQHSNYFELIYGNKEITISTIQDQLLNSESALVEYFIGKDNIFVFVIDKQDFNIVNIEKGNSLEASINSLMSMFKVIKKDGEIKYTYDKQIYTHLADSLYQGLIKPIEKYIIDKKELIIIPDGALNKMPFGALLTKKPESDRDESDFDYLLKNHAISIVYSASLLEEMQQIVHSAKAKKQVLAVAPTFKSDNDRLYYNIKEIDEIKKVTSTYGLKGRKATKDNFQKWLDQYKFIHLSTHARADSTEGEISHIMFSDIDKCNKSSLLLNSELYNLKLNADMVVLSACETGTGPFKNGEGMISLAQGFSYAGAKSIIATQWKVDDFTSNNIMKSFYRNLKKGLSKHKALQQAQLEQINGRFPRPYLWAAYVPIGDMSPVTLSPPIRIWWLLGFGMLLFVVVVMTIHLQGLKKRRR